MDGVSVACYRGNERKYKFDILVSNDGETWEEAVSGIETTGTTSDLVRYDFPEAIAVKYIRILGHGNSSNDWNNIAETIIHKHTIP